MLNGVAAALVSAALFGAGTPLAKALLQAVDPWLLAGLLYLGSGLGLSAWLGWRRLRAPRQDAAAAPAGGLTRREWPWLAGAVLAGGVIGPVLLMWGLARMAAAPASLLLNAEAVFTAVIAWVVFRENVDRRVFAGFVAIVAGAVWLSVGSAGGAAVGTGGIDLWPALAVLGACLCWGLDNNLTRQVALADATTIAAIKGAAAGSTNVALALALGAAWPEAGTVAAALIVGLAAYGISLVLFVRALRDLGTARTGAYFGVAPFFGAAAAVLALGEPVTLPLAGAGVLMALGVWLHLTEHHAHEHAHEAMEHEHDHVHDEHHRHAHAPGDEPADPRRPHRHRHRHEPLVHAHPHVPDAHHRHGHT